MFFVDGGDGFHAVKSSHQILFTGIALPDNKRFEQAVF
jgi:hypothetical protein